ncbi:hypothetical protein [Agromyces silvae]|uniref:hypothetical protein n=1 Tax=Agromyces silvae TaxID=3388266 RepID=UPI00280ADFD7|nr:hypothetical protein [Agromyces protaetiae]
MGFFDRLFGAPEPEPQRRPVSQRQPAPQARPQRQLSDDELAVERYRYLLRTAPPQTIEQVHAEAFAKLTPEQRELVYTSLAEQAPAGERPADDEPQTLARAATRQEMRQPGSMERAFAGGPGGPDGRRGGPSMGTMFAGSLLGTVAGVVVGSAIAQAFLPDPSSFDAGGDAGAGDAGAGDAGADAGSVEASGADAGYGGDFGGGDGGFSDFGGGDFGGDFGF